MSECENHKVYKELKEDIKEIKKDVRTLMSFRWQIMGGAGAIGFLLAFTLSFFKIIYQ